MKPPTLNQEILLNIASRHVNRPYCKKDVDNNESNRTSMEELTAACWNGMLHELLPELTSTQSKDNENFIWNIVSGVNFLYLTMGPCPVHIENETSLDPYYFLNTIKKN